LKAPPLAAGFFTDKMFYRYSCCNIPLIKGFRTMDAVCVYKMLKQDLGADRHDVLIPVEESVGVTSDVLGPQQGPLAEGVLVAESVVIDLVLAINQSS
jgi:hypothetical protein